MITPEFIASLRCPYCASGLETELIVPLAGDAAAIDRGIAACSCCRYPIVEGILILQQGWSFPRPRLDRVVAAVERGERVGAMDAALRMSLGAKSRASPAARLLRRFSPRIAERLEQRIDPEAVLNDKLTFEDLTRLVRPKPFADYLVYRHANPSFMAATPAMVLAGSLAGSRGEDGKGSLLDLGAGAGHASALLRRCFPDLNVITADAEFVNLCLARRMLGPGATLVALDAEVPLPFADGSLDAVFSLDAVHYMHAKVALARELWRIVRPDGAIVLSHLHNAAAFNPTPGVPLRADDWTRVLTENGARAGRLLDESAVLREFVRRGALDLSPPAAGDADADLAAAPAFTFVGGSDDLWRTHAALAETYGSTPQGLTLNPIYTRDGKGRPGVFHAAWPSESLHSECAAADALLPRQITLDEGFLTRLRTGEAAAGDAEQIRDLMRIFVLLPLPERYMREREPSD